MAQRQQYSPEFRAMAVEEVVERQRPIVDVAREFSILPGTLGNWVAKFRKENSELNEEPLVMTERAELETLRREVQELRTENEFLGKAASFFARKYR